MGRCVGITVQKGWSRIGARTGTLKNPTKCIWRWEPDRRSNFFFGPPAHLCAVTCMTEISLIVTLNNQFNSIQICHQELPPLPPYFCLLYLFGYPPPYIFAIKNYSPSSPRIFVFFTSSGTPPPLTFLTSGPPPPPYFFLPQVHPPPHAMLFFLGVGVSHIKLNSPMCIPVLLKTFFLNSV